MELKPALKALEQSDDFKVWHKNNKDTYFSYAFNIPQENPNDWQIGYYSKKKDKITTFIVSGDQIEIKPEEEVFKKEETQVKKIDLGKIKLNLDNALSSADKFQKEKFPKDKSIKTIAILQNIQILGNVWNITYITEAFNTLNMKISAENGKVIEHSFSSIFSFRKPE